MRGTDGTPLLVAWFSTAFPDGPAIGDPETMTWENFSGVLWFRREGVKDGTGVCACRYKLEDDGRHVRRLKSNVLSRTAIAMDIEASKKTGELPPTPDDLADKIEAKGWAAAVWTSHNHRAPDSIRCRVVLPLSAETDHQLPTVEIVAGDLGIDGVLDRSKVGASSFFYLPSCPDNAAEQYQEIIVPGAAMPRGSWSAPQPCRKPARQRLRGQQQKPTRRQQRGALKSWRRAAILTIR